MIKKRLLVIILPFTLVIVLPVLFLFIESLLNDNGRISIEHLKTLVLTSRQLGLMKNSVLLAAGATLFSVLLGVPLAFLITRTDLPLKRVFNVAYLIPLFLPPYIQAITWIRYLDPVRTVGSETWAPALPVSFIYSIPGAIFIFTLSFFPFVTLITSSGFRSVDGSMEEASLMTEGVFSTIRGVTLPLVFPQITTGAIFVFVFTIINLEVADILRLRVFPIEIFINFSAYYNAKAATILSLPLIFLTLLLIWGQMVYMKGRSYVNFGSTDNRAHVFKLGRLKYLAFLFPSVLCIVSVGLPLWELVNGAGPFGNYVKAFSGSKDQIFYSIYISAFASFVMVSFSYAVAYYLERAKGILRTLLEYITQIPFGVPCVVLGIGLIKVWNRQGFDWIYESSIILVIAFVSGYSPFVIKILCAKIKQIDEELEEAAILGGVSGTKIFFKILLPLSAPGIMAGFLVGFAFSLSNLSTALLVVAPGKTTLPITIYNFMHYGADETVYGLSIILIIIIAFAMALLYPVYRFTAGKIRV